MKKRSDLDILESLERINKFYGGNFSDFEINFMESMMTKLHCDLSGLTTRQRNKALEIEDRYLNGDDLPIVDYD